MTAQLDRHDGDAPIFASEAFRLSDAKAELIARARAFGRRVLAPRAEKHDREASFPIENYRDLHPEGLLGDLHPEGGWRSRRRLPDLLPGRRRDRPLLRRHRAHLEHACLLDAVVRRAGRRLDDGLRRARRSTSRRRACTTSASSTTARSMRSHSRKAAPPQPAASRSAPRREPVDGGWRRQRQEDFRVSLRRMPTITACSAPRRRGRIGRRRNTLYLAVPADANGISVIGDWDPLGMRGTVSRTLLFKDVFVPEEELLMPRGVYFQAATRWPHMFLTLSPTYMGLAQAAYDFTVRYLRGEMPGTPPVKRRMYPTKQIAVAQMQIKLEQTKALWFQAISEAAPQSDQGAGAARLRRAVHRDGERQRDRHPGDPHLRRPGHAEVAAAGADLSRQPLRLADAAMDRRTLSSTASAARRSTRPARRTSSAAYGLLRSDRAERGVHAGQGGAALLRPPVDLRGALATASRPRPARSSRSSASDAATGWRSSPPITPIISFCFTLARGSVRCWCRSTGGSPLPSSCSFSWTLRSRRCSCRTRSPP